MNIYELLVEGKTESQVINAIKASTNTNILIERKGSKDTLPTEVMYERSSKKRNDIYLLRDRDFDFDVSEGIFTPQPLMKNGTLLGWHWCRHEMENYLLEPELVCKAIPHLKIEDYLEALTSTAEKIRFYVSARWTIGYAKRKTHIPPYYSLRTKPELRGEFSLPDNLEEEAVQLWMREEASTFYEKINKVLSVSSLNEKYLYYKEYLSIEKCKDIPSVLHNFPGKNLFAGLTTWLALYQLDPGKLKGYIINYVTKNPEEAVALIPEWQELIRLWSSTK